MLEEMLPADREYAGRPKTRMECDHSEKSFSHKSHDPREMPTC